MGTTAVAQHLITAFMPFATLTLVVGYGPQNQVYALPSSGNDPCGGEFYGTEGVITSPNFPDDYPHNADCQWIVTSPENNIEVFHTYDSSDWLEIRDGNSSDSTNLWDHWGTHSNEEVTSTGNSLFFRFHAGGYASSEDCGFKLSWIAGPICYYCSNFPDSDVFDPLCGIDNYHGHSDSKIPSMCYTNVHYDGSHHVERGMTENIVEDGTCFDTGYSISCFCTRNGLCNTDLCQHCNTSTSSLDSTTSQPLTSSTTKAPYNFTTRLSTTSYNTPVTSLLPVTTIAPSEDLHCYSCLNCNEINEDTDVESSEDFLSCFTAIDLEGDHFVLHGGSPDYYEDGLCRHEADGVFVCYCTSNRCNSDAALM